MNSDTTELRELAALMLKKADKLLACADEMAKSTDRIPTGKDVGRWVQVRDSEGQAWRGPHVLADTDSNPAQFRTKQGAWRQARLIDHPTVVNWSLHDGSKECPIDRGPILVMYKNKAISSVHNPSVANWLNVSKYTILETE